LNILVICYSFVPANKKAYLHGNACAISALLVDGENLFALLRVKRSDLQRWC